MIEIQLGFQQRKLFSRKRQIGHLFISSRLNTVLWRRHNALNFKISFVVNKYAYH